MAARLGNPLLREGVYQSSLTRLMEKAVTCQSSSTGYRPQGISRCSSSPDFCLADLLISGKERSKLTDLSHVEIDPLWSLQLVFPFSLPFQLPCPKLKKQTEREKRGGKGL